MRIILKILVFSVVSTVACSQSAKYGHANQNQASAAAPRDVSYRLFPTQNMWTFIKLNTRNGQMWQVQYDIQGNNRHETYLSLESLISLEDEENDRFALYPTQNIYNFILMDQFSGKVWQVQWATELNNRGIISIE
jgi:hypothetical protein